MKVTIVGTGAYGIALASSLNKYNKIKLWTKFANERDELIKTRESINLIGYKIPDDIEITDNLEEISDSEIIIIAIPAEFVENTIKDMIPYINKKQHFVIATKGIEEKSGRFIFDILKSYINTSFISVISGPSFASDVAKGTPIGLSIASKSKKTINVIKHLFSYTNIKLRDTKDMIGVSLCGSIKNIIAIASGMLDGLNGNPSVRAMFITESLHDIKAMIKKLGGDGKTILSYSGFGDLLLTCTSEKSRNYSFGKLLSTSNASEIDKYKNTHTIEGLYTLKSVYKLLKNKKVDIPIINLIYNIVYRNTNPQKLLTFLMEKE